MRARRLLDNNIAPGRPRHEAHALRRGFALNKLDPRWGIIELGNDLSAHRKRKFLQPRTIGLSIHHDESGSTLAPHSRSVPPTIHRDTFRGRNIPAWNVDLRAPARFYKVCYPYRKQGLVYEFELCSHHALPEPPDITHCRSCLQPTLWRSPAANRQVGQRRRSQPRCHAQKQEDPPVSDTFHYHTSLMRLRL